jgi:phage-related baseplate assembly protein
MSSPAAAVLLVMASCACASSAESPAVAQTMSTTEITLAPGESRSVPESKATLTFEAVSEDSRCPTGVTCIWEGDAAVRIRIEVPGEKPGTYTLHTSDRFGREAEHGSIRIRLVSVSPHPTAEGPVKAEDYRVTFAVDRR